ncbi:hypothetical protein AK88_03722 [Plasmodium fragile]|uniref:Uncharacterized protein n=1 Tax=Plasmodium fragile TaxID=5857 RepID=A0A0D9QI54_PLAFR|nr:uncharacterized protein AK88_03722 [Plasmodium fragile]KJP86618.1 hypothetical protein AK88_03722 [Plasmodium fragile]
MREKTNGNNNGGAKMEKEHENNQNDDERTKNFVIKYNIFNPIGVLLFPLNMKEEARNFYKFVKMTEPEKDGCFFLSANKF